jgi:uncharacterized protein (TIGR03066 family)
MKAVGMVGTACVLLCLAACSGETKEVKTVKKLAGTWELIKSPDPLIVGSTMEFDLDLRLKATVKVLGESQVVEGHYFVQGDKLTTVVKRKSGAELAEEVTIKTLTDTTLITVHQNGKESEYKKK